MSANFTIEKFIFQRSIFYALSFITALWLVKAIEWGASTSFSMFGILPRTLSGTVGIFTAPLIHENFMHLASNTTSLVLLMIALFYFYDKIALEVFLWIYLMTGFWVWIAARPAYHIGASGLVYGIVTFLFFSGLLRKDARTMAVSMIILFLYGSLIYGIFPTHQRISWESHLLGSAAGAFCAFYFRKTVGSRLFVVAAKPLEVDNSEMPKPVFSAMSNTYTQDKEEKVLVYEFVKRKDKNNKAE